MEQNEIDQIQERYPALRGKTVLVVGAGKSGMAAAKAAFALGAHVSIQDMKEEAALNSAFLAFAKNNGIAVYAGRWPENSSFDQIILSPGVSPELPAVRKEMEKGAEISGELELAYRVARSPFLAITGTNGKTTTTTLVGEIMRAAHRHTYVVGNIGDPVVSAALKAGAEDWLVTEVSSFQLETTKDFHPLVSAILNITPDHLNRHHTMEAYAREKAKVFANQKENDWFIWNAEDPICASLAAEAPCRTLPFSSKRELDQGAFLHEDRLVLRVSNGNGKAKKEQEAPAPLIDICGREELRIIGMHNVENALAAAAIARCAGVEPAVIGEAIRAFGGVEHRIEYCGTRKGVRYYNDSKGTNVDAALTAIRAIEKNILLIAGGDAKGQVFDPFIQGFNGAVKKMFLLGRDAHLIAEAADRKGFHEYVYCRDMEDCVRQAASSAREKDTVLLSPACASWDMYPDYEKRGEHFKQCVNKLEK